MGEGEREDVEEGAQVDLAVLLGLEHAVHDLQRHSVPSKSCTANRWCNNQKIWSCMCAWQAQSSDLQETAALVCEVVGGTLVDDEGTEKAPHSSRVCITHLR